MGGMSGEVRGNSKIEAYLNYVRLVEGFGGTFNSHEPDAKKKKVCKSEMGAGSGNRGMDSALPFPHVVGWWCQVFPGRKAVTLTKLLKWLPDLRKGEPGTRVEAAQSGSPWLT